MSKQQYGMAAEVSKALAELPETHRYLAPMVHRLFMHWKLSDDEQLALFGLLPRTRGRGLSEGDAEPLGAVFEMTERVGHLLSIHQHLRTLFPQNRSLGCRWMTSANDAFDGQTPVKVVRDHGVGGLLMLRAYLEHARGI